MKGRKPKPSLSEAEFLALVPILTQPRGKHGGSLERAALEVTRMRGAHEATDPRTQRLRSVSGRWVLRELTKRHIPGKKGMQAKYGNSQGPQQLRQNPGEGVHTGSRIASVGTPGAQQAQIAPFNDGVQQPKTGLPGFTGENGASKPQESA